MAVIQLTSPLILASDPTLPLHLVTKRYADAKVTNLSASGFSSGTLSVARLPQFLGDVTMPAGGGTLTVTPTGVTAGTYTKVTVSSSGRILAGSALTAGDVPPISWNKIVSGKPTTLAGYGITDALTASGGTITGDLSITTSPVNNYHLANKNYVDGSIVPGGDSIVVGDIVRVANVATPTGFLRANGGKVSKTTYAALYSIIGDRYQKLVNSGIEQPWVHQAPIQLSGSIVDGVRKTAVFDLTSFMGSSAFGYRSVINSFVLKNRFYLLYTENALPADGSTSGDGATLSDLTYLCKCISFLVNADGSLTNPNQESMFNFYMGSTEWNSRFHYHFNVFVLNNKVYTVGSSAIKRASIDINGGIGSFSTYLTYTALGQHGLPRSNHIKPVVVGNKLYLIDYPYGSTGYNFPADVVSFDVNSNGDLSNLTSYGNIHSSAMRLNVREAFVYKNKMIVIASNVSAGDVTVRTGEYTAYYASINGDDTLGPWTVGPKIVVAGDWYMPMVVTTETGISVIFYTTSGWGSGAYNCSSHKLNTDSSGTPISWSPLFNFSLSPTTQDALISGKLPVSVVKDRLYVNAAFDLRDGDFSNPWPVRALKFDYLDFSGGVNDYSPYYNGSLSQPDPLNFFLPDFTAKETPTTKYFIKT